MGKFVLDPDYENFASNEQLKLITVNPLDTSIFRYLGAIIFVFGSITLLLIMSAINKHMESRAYAVDGQPVDVTVTQCEMVNYGRVGYKPKLTYSYIINDITYQNSDTMLITLHDDCDNYPAGLTMPARYLPLNPQQSQLSEAITPNYVTGDILAHLLGSLMTGVVTIFMLNLWVGHQRNYWRDNGRYRRLRSNGVLLDGEIVSTEGILLKRDNAYYFFVDYRFQTPDGRTLTRKQSLIRNDLRDVKLPAGTPVSVLYADDNAVVML